MILNKKLFELFGAVKIHSSEDSVDCIANEGIIEVFLYCTVICIYAICHVVEEEKF